MLDNRMGLMFSGNDVYLGNIGTTDSAIPNNAKFIISTNDSSYYVQGYNTDKALKTSGGVTEVEWSTYSAIYLNYNWLITKSTQTMHGIDITAKTDTLAMGDTFQSLITSGQDIAPISTH